MIEGLPNNEILKAINDLVQSQGWRILKEIIERNDLAKLKQDIFEELSKGHEANFQKLIFMNARKDILEDTLKLPNDLIKTLTESRTEVPNHDPYFASREEIDNQEKN